jgi:hypothetical protein
VRTSDSAPLWPEALAVLPGPGCRHPAWVAAPGYHLSLMAEVTFQLNRAASSSAI